MEPIVSVIMGSTSDLPVMEKALAFLNEQQIPFEVNALSAHRTPDDVEVFARSAEERGIKVIIAAALCRAGQTVYRGTVFLPDHGGRCRRLYGDQPKLSLPSVSHYDEAVAERISVGVPDQAGMPAIESYRASGRKYCSFSWI